MRGSRSGLLAPLDCFTGRGWLALSSLLFASCGEQPASMAPPGWFGPIDAGSDAGPVGTVPDGDAEAPLPDESGSWTWQACGTIKPASNAQSEQTVQVEFGLGGNVLVAVLANGSIVSHTVDEIAPRVLKAPDGLDGGIALSVDGGKLAQWKGEQIVVRSVSDGVAIGSITTEPACAGTVRFSADGDYLVTFGEALCAVRWNDGTVVARIAQHFLSAALAGDVIFGVDPAGAVARFDLSGRELGRAILSFDAKDPIVAARLAPSADVVAARTHGGRAALYDASTGTSRWSGQDCSSALVFSPDGKYAVVGTTLLRTSDGFVIRDTCGTSGPPDALSPNPERAAEIHEGGSAIVETRTSASLRAFVSHNGEILGLALSGDGKRLATTGLVGSHSHAGIGWSVASKFAETRATWIAQGLALFPAYSTDGSLAAMSGDPRWVVDGEGGVPLPGLPPAPPEVVVGCYWASFDFSPRGRWIAGGGYRASIDVFDLPGLGSVRSLPSQRCNAAAAFPRDESLLATSGPELYRTSTWERVWPTDLPPAMGPSNFDSSSFESVRFDPQETRILVSRCGMQPNDCRHSFFSVETGASMGDLSFNARRPSFSPGGRWIVGGDTLIDLRSGQRQTIAPGASESLFAPNGDIIAGGRDGSLTRYCREPLRAD